MPQQLLDTGPPLVARITDRAVVVGIVQVPAMLVDDRLAALDLCLDRLLILAVGRIARVLKAGAALFEFVEHVIDGGETRPALGFAITDLLDDLALLASDAL